VSKVLLALAARRFRHWLIRVLASLRERKTPSLSKEEGLETVVSVVPEEARLFKRGIAGEEDLERVVGGTGRV